MHQQATAIAKTDSKTSIATAYLAIAQIQAEITERFSKKLISSRFGIINDDSSHLSHVRHLFFSFVH